MYREFIVIVKKLEVLLSEEIIRFKVLGLKKRCLYMYIVSLFEPPYRAKAARQILFEFSRNQYFKKYHYNDNFKIRILEIG